VNEAMHACLPCDLQQLTRSFDVGIPELLARAPLLHEGGTVNDGFAATDRLGGDSAELATYWRRSQRADGRIATFRPR
jgi:hypothetical protein